MTKKTLIMPISITVLIILVSGAMGAFDLMVQKWVALACLVGTIAMLVISKAKYIFKEYTTPLFIATLIYVAWNGISIFYSAVPKAGLFEFTKLAGAIAIFFLVLFFTNPTKKGVLATCSSIATTTAFFGFISIDAASNGPFSYIFKAFMSLFTNSMEYFGGFENGIRMTGIFGNANTFAGFMALGVILSLGLVMNSIGKYSKFGSIALLAINSLAYILLFSLGSLFVFIIGCLLMLFSSKPSDRLTLFVLMVETVISTLLCTGIALISMGSNPALPLIAIILNVIILYLFDIIVSNILVAKLAINRKSSLIGGSIVVVVVLCYLIAALNITGALTLAPSETIMRATYLDAGEYQLNSVLANDTAQPQSPTNVRITTQNKTDLKTHTYTDIYNGALSDAIFTVPSDSKIIKMYFTGSAEGSTIETASIVGTSNNTTEKVKLGYKLLPGIIANRIQDLGANQNTIQRLVFFEDGLKLFKKSPIIGQGISGYETGVSSVQNFYYETRYVHNHYIQVLCDLGIVGFAIFISMLALCIWHLLKLFKQSKASNFENVNAFLLPALVACIVQIFGQAITDLTWSAGPFLVACFAILALLIMTTSRHFEISELQALNETMMPSSESNSVEATHKFTGDKTFRIICGVLAITMTGLLGTNLYAHYKASSGNCTMAQMAQLTKLDKFESDDYKITYIVTANTYGLSENFEQANKYASQLTHNPDAVLNYLLPYYFNTAQDDKLFETATLVADMGKADPSMWNQLFNIFNIAIAPERDNPMPIIMHLMEKKDYYIDGILSLYNQLQDRNSIYLDDAMLSNSNVTFLNKMLGLEALDKSRLIEILDLFVKTIYTSEYSVDVNNDAIPDNIKVLSGNTAWGQTQLESKLRFDGSMSAEKNTVIELDAYCIKGGNYVLRLSDLKGIGGTAMPKDIIVTVDGTPINVQYDDTSAFANITLKGATAADEENNITATIASEEKIVISIPSGMEISKLSLRK